MPVKKSEIKKNLSKEELLRVLDTYENFDKELSQLRRRVDSLRREFQKRSDQYQLEEVLKHLTRLSEK